MELQPIWNELEQIGILQIPDEWNFLAEGLLKINPKIIVEIGTYQGATAIGWKRLFPKAKIICIDYEMNVATKNRLAVELIDYIIGDSHQESTVQELESRLGENKIDFLFIDGDHTFKGVKQDVEMYSKLVRDEGLIVLHDITAHPEKYHCQVHEYFKTIPSEHTNWSFNSYISSIKLPHLTPRKEEVYGGIGLITYRIIPDVAIMVMAHSFDSDQKKQLFTNCILQLNQEQVPKYLVYDQDADSNKWFHKIIQSDLFKEWRFIPNAPSPEWEKFRFGYNIIQAKAIAICHQDDLWIGGKLQKQMQYINKAAVVLSSYINYQTDSINKDHSKRILGQTVICTPFVNGIWGLTFAMPSSWVINKTIVPQIPEPFKEVFSQDIAIISTIGAKYGPIICVRDPLVIYHDHGQNQWYESNPERFEYGNDLLHNCIKTLPPIKLIYDRDFTGEINQAQELPELTTQMEPILSDKKYKIVVVGWFEKDKYGYGIANELERLGHTVYRVSTDKPLPSTHIDKNVWDALNGISLADRQDWVHLAQWIPQDYDLIILGLSTQVYFDCQCVHTPIALYQTEYGYPQIPINCESLIGWFFYTYPRCPDQFYFNFGPQFNLIPVKHMLPWGVNLGLYHSDSNNSHNIPIGFKGSFKWDAKQRFVDPNMVDFYQKRNEILSEIGSLVYCEDRGTLSELVQFHQSCKAIVNIPGKELCNERQYFAWACKNLLYQYEYPELKQLGFKNRYNCLTFTDTKSLRSQIIWATDPKNKDKVQFIIDQGYKTVQQHSWACRAREMLSVILPTLDQMKDTCRYNKENPMEVSIEYLNAINPIKK